MRVRSAPEVRGTIRRYRQGLLALGACLFALSASADIYQRQLIAAPGEAKPAFALRDLDGSTHALREQAGRVVLVHFFATWCEPCREELGSLSRLTERNPADRLTVVAVNVAEVPIRVKRFLESTPVAFRVLLDADRAVTKAWDISTLPTTYVLDRALVPRLFVEGDLDWVRADVVAALEQVGEADPRRD